MGEGGEVEGQELLSPFTAGLASGLEHKARINGVGGNGNVGDGGRGEVGGGELSPTTVWIRIQHINRNVTLEFTVHVSRSISNRY